LLLVSVCWLIITAKQGGIVTVTAPINFRNLPDELVLVNSSPDQVEVQLRAVSGLIPSPKQLDIVADVNLAKVRDGVNQLAIKGDDFQLPLGVKVTGINPSIVKVTLEKKVRKTLRIKVKTSGILSGKQSFRKIRVEPSSVIAEGPEHAMTQLDSVETEDVDLSSMQRGTVLEKRLLAPAPQVKILRDEPVRVRLGKSGP
jgi:diadenylate cyclase